MDFINIAILNHCVSIFLQKNIFLTLIFKIYMQNLRSKYFKVKQSSYQAFPQFIKLKNNNGCNQMSQHFFLGGNNIGYGSLAIYQARQANDFNLLEASEYQNISPVKPFPISHKSKHNYNVTKNSFEDQSQVFNYFNGKYDVRNHLQNPDASNAKNRQTAIKKPNQKLQYQYSNENMPLKSFNKFQDLNSKSQFKKGPQHINFAATKNDEKYDQYMNLYNQYQKLRQRCKQNDEDNQRLKNELQNYKMNEQYFQQLAEQNKQLKARFFQRESSHPSFRMHSQVDDGVNRFYVQELEKKNMQLQQENKRISSLLMKKLRTPFC